MKFNYKIIIACLKIDFTIPITYFKIWFIIVDLKIYTVLKVHIYCNSFITHCVSKNRRKVISLSSSDLQTYRSHWLVSTSVQLIRSKTSAAEFLTLSLPSTIQFMKTLLGTDCFSTEVYRQTLLPGRLLSRLILSRWTEEMGQAFHRMEASCSLLIVSKVAFSCQFWFVRMYRLSEFSFLACSTEII